MTDWRKAKYKSHVTELNALTFTKYMLNKKGWRYVDFQSKRGYARTGIIDLVAVKLDKENPDILGIALFQVKGGSARITSEQRRRLARAVNKMRIDYCYVEKPIQSVVLAWNPDIVFSK